MISRAFRDRFQFLSKLLVAHESLLIILVLTMFGAFLRLYHIAYKSLWLDEAVLFWISQGSLADIVAANAIHNSAPPLFPLLVNFLSRIGQSEATLRSLSLLAGVASIPVMYCLARQFLSRESAYLPTLLVALSVTQIKYSQQVREYSTAFLCSLLILLTLCEYRRNPRLTNSVLLLLIWVVSMFVQYGLALLMFGLSLGMLFNLAMRTKNRSQRDVTRQLLQWGIIQIPLLGSAVAVYFLSLKYELRLGGFGASPTSNYLRDSYWIHSQDAIDSITSLCRLIVNKTYALFDFSYPYPFLLLFFVSLGIYWMFRTRQRLLITMLITPWLITLILACSKLYPYSGVRQNIYLVPMIYIMAGSGLDYMLKCAENQRVPIIVVAVVVFVLNGVGPTRQYFQSTEPEHMRPIAQTLLGLIRPEDKIYVYYGAKPAFTYYFRDHLDKYQCIYGVQSREDPTNYLQQVERVTEEYETGRLWAVFSHCYQDECNLIVGRMSELRSIQFVSAGSGVSLYLLTPREHP